MKIPQPRRPWCALPLIGALVLTGGVLAGSGDKVLTMDTNQDGMISAAEHATGAQMKFDKMDADRDGSISSAEVVAGQQAMRVEGMQADKASMDKHAEKMRAMDRNGDGMISAAEHTAAAAQMFSSMDSNGDGSLSAAELGAVHEAK